MKIKYFPALIAAASVLASTHAPADPLPPPGYSPDMSSDEAGLWMEVDKEEAAIKVSPLRVTDPALNAYVRAIICKTAGPYCDTMRVYIVENSEFNAFAMPNGAVVVFTGLLLRVNNEAQLSFVLGHEVTHFLHRHSLETLRRQVLTTGLVNFVSLATAGAGLAGGGDLAILVGTGIFYSHSRDEERDADANGMKIGIDNGYDPREAAAIWRDMDAESGQQERQYRNAFLADHPATPERLATLTKIANDTPPRDNWIVNAPAYRDVMAPFVERWVIDELNRGQPRQSAILFQRLAATDPATAVYKYALGEAYRRRNLAGDAQLAGAAYRDALACTAPPPQAWRGLGLLAIKMGDKDEAKKDFTAYRAAAPDADDKAMIDFYLTQL